MMKFIKSHPAVFFAVIAIMGAAAVFLNVSWTARVKRTYPAHGAVFLGDKPVRGARVILTPVETVLGQTVVSAGTSQEDGSFTLSTFNNDDGAPAGEYYVMIYQGTKALPGLDPGPEQRGFRVRIVASENKLEPFKLKKPPEAPVKKTRPLAAP